MDCPKCNTRMLEDIAVSRASTVEREDLIDCSLVHGFTCWCCGMWIDIDPVPMPMPPKMISRMGARPTLNPLVVKYFDSITAERTKGTTWQTISFLLFAAVKQRVSASTIKKHFTRLSAGVSCGA